MDFVTYKTLFKKSNVGSYLIILWKLWHVLQVNYCYSLLTLILTNFMEIGNDVFSCIIQRMLKWRRSNSTIGGGKSKRILEASAGNL